VAVFRRKGEWLEVVVPDAWQGQTVEAVLAGPLRVPARLRRAWLREARVVVGTHPARPDEALAAGARLRLHAFAPEDYGVNPEPHPIEVLYEDDHVLVVNKPAGMIVHPDRPGGGGTLANAVAYHYLLNGIAAKPRHIHRLDRDTTGVVLYAKHPWAHAVLDAELRERCVRREYVALVAGRLRKKRGTLRFPIARDRKNRQRRCVSPAGQPAVTHYEVLETFRDATLVRAWLETGRTHQIRVHFAHIGHPLMGDVLYGGPPAPLGRQALHAWRVTFSHPLTRSWETVEAPWPDDLQAAVADARAAGKGEAPPDG
jgi:pseudouridine synthase, RluA family